MLPRAGSRESGRRKDPFEAHGVKSFPVTMETGTVGSSLRTRECQPGFKHKTYTGHTRSKKPRLRICSLAGRN